MSFVTPKKRTKCGKQRTSLNLYPHSSRMTAAESAHQSNRYQAALARWQEDNK
jgi:hypothetical protein